MILLATCYGGSFARSIRVSDQAPVLALIGPPAEITAGQSEVDFRNLYRVFFANNSIAEALAALERNGTRYFGTTARGFFLSVWRDYRINHCSDDRLRERARELALRARAQALPRKSIGQFMRELRAIAPRTFAESRSRYFMDDLYPDHRERFALSFEEADVFARKKSKSKPAL